MATYADPFPQQYLGVVTQAFGATPGEWGVDIGLPSGTPIEAPFSGTITHEESLGGAAWGDRIQLSGGPQGEAIDIGHLQAFAVPVGTHVTAGEVIGISGGGLNDPNHGNTTGPHIEFQLQPGGGNPNVKSTFADPMTYLQGLYSGGQPYVPGVGGPSSSAGTPITGADVVTGNTSAGAAGASGYSWWDPRAWSAFAGQVIGGAAGAGAGAVASGIFTGVATGVSAFGQETVVPWFR